MSFAKRVALAVNVQTNMSGVYTTLSGIDFLRESEIHIVHVCPIITYPLVVSGMTMTFPIEDDRRHMERWVLGELMDLSRQILPRAEKERLNYHCLFSENPKHRFTQFLQEMRIDLAIIAAREKHGLFESSFAQYVTKESKSNVMILKHQ